jgi:hypothetical protein
MTRPTLTLIAFAALAAWASAQGPARGPTAAEQLAQFRANRPLLERLIDQALRLSAEPDPVGRAEECRQAAAALGWAVQSAANQDQADRVAELADNLHALLTDGLTPALRSAGDGVPPESEAGKRLAEVRGRTRDDLVRVLNEWRADGRLGQSPAARAARAKLQAAADAFQPKPAGP